MELNILPQKIQVDYTLAIASKDKLPSVAMLRHMVRNIYYYDTRKTRHQELKCQKTSSLSPVPSSVELSWHTKVGI